MMKTAPTDPDTQITDISEDSTEIVDLRNEILENLPDGVYVKYYD